MATIFNGQTPLVVPFTVGPQTFGPPINPPFIEQVSIVFEATLPAIPAGAVAIGLFPSIVIHSEPAATYGLAGTDLRVHADSHTDESLTEYYHYVAASPSTGDNGLVPATTNDTYLVAPDGSAFDGSGVGAPAWSHSVYRRILNLSGLTVFDTRAAAVTDDLWTPRPPEAPQFAIGALGFADSFGLQTYAPPYPTTITATYIAERHMTGSGFTQEVFTVPDARLFVLPIFPTASLAIGNLAQGSVDVRDVAVAGNVAGS